MISRFKKYELNFIDFDTRAHIEIYTLSWIEDAPLKKFKDLFKLIVAWQHFGLLDEIASDLKDAMNNIEFYFGLYGREKERLYKRLYKVLKYLENMYLIDIGDFHPELASL